METSSVGAAGSVSDVAAAAVVGVVDVDRGCAMTSAPPSSFDPSEPPATGSAV